MKTKKTLPLSLLLCLGASLHSREAACDTTRATHQAGVSLESTRRTQEARRAAKLADNAANQAISHTNKAIESAHDAYKAKELAKTASHENVTANRHAKINHAKDAVKDKAYKVANVAKDAASRAQKTAKETVHEVAQAVEGKAGQIKHKTA